MLPVTSLARIAPWLSISAYAVLVPPPSTPRNMLRLRPAVDADALHDAIDDTRCVRTVGSQAKLQRLSEGQDLREHDIEQRDLQIAGAAQTFEFEPFHSAEIVAARAHGNKRARAAVAAQLVKQIVVVSSGIAVVRQEQDDQ